MPGPLPGERCSACKRTLRRSQRRRRRSNRPFHQRDMILPNQVRRASSLSGTSMPSSSPTRTPQSSREVKRAAPDGGLSSRTCAARGLGGLAGRSDLCMIAPGQPAWSSLRRHRRSPPIENSLAHGHFAITDSHPDQFGLVLQPCSTGDVGQIVDLDGGDLRIAQGHVLPLVVALELSDTAV